MSQLQLVEEFKYTALWMCVFWRGLGLHDSVVLLAQYNTNKSRCIVTGKGLECSHQLSHARARELWLVVLGGGWGVDYYVPSSSAGGQKFLESNGPWNRFIKSIQECL